MSPMASSLSTLWLACCSFQNTSALRRSWATVLFWIESPAMIAIPSAVATASAIVPALWPGAATTSTPAAAGCLPRPARICSSYRLITDSVHCGQPVSL